MMGVFARNLNEMQAAKRVCGKGFPKFFYQLYVEISNLGKAKIEIATKIASS